VSIHPLAASIEPLCTHTQTRVLLPSGLHRTLPPPPQLSPSSRRRIPQSTTDASLCLPLPPSARPPPTPRINQYTCLLLLVQPPNLKLYPKGRSVYINGEGWGGWGQKGTHPRARVCARLNRCTERMRRGQSIFSMHESLFKYLKVCAPLFVLIYLL
jgi:hypothetical protein